MYIANVLKFIYLFIENINLCSKSINLENILKKKFMGKGKGKFFFFFFFAEVLNLSGIFLIFFFFLSTLDLIKFIKNSCSLNSPLYIRVIYIYIYNL